jgi:hypothetical protein
LRPVDFRLQAEKENPTFGGVAAGTGRRIQIRTENLKPTAIPHESRIFTTNQFPVLSKYRKRQTQNQVHFI